MQEQANYAWESGVNRMKYFLVEVILLYDGYEWRTYDLVEARNLNEAKVKAEKTDYTHAESGEIQQIAAVTELLLGHYLVLRAYLG